MIEFLSTLPTIFWVSYSLLSVVFGIFFAWELLEDPNMWQTVMPNFMNVMAGFGCGILFPITLPGYLLAMVSKTVARVLVRLKYGE